MLVVVEWTQGRVTPGSLRLAAIYGAALALTVIVLGAPVGRWVDRTSRLRAAQLSLSVQNLMVCLCAALLVLITSYPNLFREWDGWALVVAEAGVILTACVAQIGTLGSKLAIEKDWILVICGRDKTQLARMNSVLRTVDLSTEVLAPVIVGAVMTSFGLMVGGIVIAAWNVGSLLVEYGLLHHLFYSNPHLQKSKGEVNNEGGSGEGEENIGSEGDKSSQELPDMEAERQRRREGQGMSQALERLTVAWSAWRAYMHHPVRNAGLGLALLFMTVLAFDNYSRAFVYDSGVSETVLGLLTAVASLFGIFGSLAFPVLRKKVGLVKTGLVGFCCETLCLTLCVASVFAPGSPFDASAILYGPITPGKAPTLPNAPAIPAASPATPQYGFNASSVLSDSRSLVVDFNSTLEEQLPPDLDSGVQEEEEERDFTFVILFMTGIITSRFGLWLADLTVTQILQEGVEEGQRGAINGVQSSLNQSLDLLRSVLLIILPRRETFGFLVLLSFLFVSMAFLMFASYVRTFLINSTKPAAVPEGHQLKPADV
ncbi:hypothetical protein O3P69_014512 [Scylla paramamosain]|uniref:Solute carrier family 40 member n=1 Tax=Scylla paramamosain TaxID=85552 RepID=A0AAW0TCV8_SCYPA